MQTQTYFFQYNIPQDNNDFGRTDDYINIIAKWDGGLTSGPNKTPCVFVDLINGNFASLLPVKDLWKVFRDVEAIAQRHFKYSAELGIDNPVVERNNARVLGTITVNENGVAEPAY